MPEGAGVVSALIMDNRLGRLRVSISVGGAIVFIIGSMNDQESRSMERTVGREAADEKDNRYISKAEARLRDGKGYQNG